MSRRRYRSITPPARSEEQEPRSARFPLFAFAMCSLCLSGLFHFLLVVFPAELAYQGRGVGVLERSVVTAVATLGARPIVAFVIFVATLAPGLLFYEERARRYLCTVTVIALIACVSSYMVAKNPTARLSHAINAALDVERPLPPTYSPKS